MKLGRLVLVTRVRVLRTRLYTPAIQLTKYTSDIYILASVLSIRTILELNRLCYAHVVQELLLAYCYTLLRYCYHPLCLRLLFYRRLSFYLFYVHYVHHWGLYHILFCRFLISKIDVALQLTKL